MHGAYAIPRVGYFYSRPCGRGDSGRSCVRSGWIHFYSRPCGRGDFATVSADGRRSPISTHAPAGGATQSALPAAPILADFYSRPCGRGDLFYWAKEEA